MKSDMTYLENGVLVTVLPTYAPRKAEKTFPAMRYSISNMGRKQVTMKKAGFKSRGIK